MLVSDRGSQLESLRPGDLTQYVSGNIDIFRASRPDCSTASMSVSSLPPSFGSKSKSADLRCSFSCTDSVAGWSSGFRGSVNMRHTRSAALTSASVSSSLRSQCVSAPPSTLRVATAQRQNQANGV